MRSQCLATVAAAFALLSAGAAQAEGQTASASFNITVIIPPLAEAIAAREAGAAGDWTVLSPRGGFMIDMPTAEDEEENILTIFRSDRQRFALNVAGDGAGLSLAPTRMDSSGSLTALAFALPAPTAASSHTRLVFSGI